MSWDQPHWYILEGHAPVPCDDFMDWCKWMEITERHVRLSEQGDVWISTVFLGLNHNFFGIGPPILFETMVFIGHDGISQERYATWEQAEEGHTRWVNEIFKPTPILTLAKEKD